MTPERLSRRQRRILSRTESIINNKNLESTTVLSTIDEVLENADDIGFLERERSKFSQALVFDKNFVGLLRVYSDAGASEEILREMYTAAMDPKAEENHIIFREINLGQRSDLAKRLGASLQGIFRARRAYKDEDDEQILKMIKKGIDVPLLDLLAEKSRGTFENINLINLQMDWIREKKRKERREKSRMIRLAKRRVEERDTVGEGAEEGPLVTENDFIEEAEVMPLVVEGRELFWTRRFFSSDPGYLVSINAGSREVASEEVSRLGRGQISIKPESIISAIEFHLRRDVLQRALAARINYGPEGIREWVKIKRGDDRIFLWVPDDSNSLVFFAAGRDVVYRGL